MRATSAFCHWHGYALLWRRSCFTELSWPSDRCRLLARKSFEALPPGGRIVVHEILFNENRTGPFVGAGFNVNMLTLMKGEQYSGREISAFLADAGFRRVQVKPTFGYWSIVTGVKPRAWLSG